MKFSKIFTVLALAPQIINTGLAIYETVKKIDDDPAVKAAFAQVKENVLAAETIKTLRVQAAVLKSLVKQLT